MNGERAWGVLTRPPDPTLEGRGVLTVSRQKLHPLYLLVNPMTSYFSQL